MKNIGKKKNIHRVENICVLIASLSGNQSSVGTRVSFYGTEDSFSMFLGYFILDFIIFHKEEF